MVDVGFMHTIDLGVLLYLHGGAMWLMCRNNEYINQRTQELRCKTLWRMIQKEYKDRLHTRTLEHTQYMLCSPCPQDQQIDRKLPQLKLSMFKPPSTVDYPCLKSKAAVSRALVGPMTAVCEKVLA
eukprot:457350-Pyramimonas_sp.AAC.1